MKMVTHLLLACSLLGMANVAVGQPLAAVECSVLAEANWDEFVPGGKEVDAIYGDIVLRNEYVTAVIAQPLAKRHANMTVHDVGGCLIDLTSRAFESDQLSAYYPGAKAYPYRRWVIIDADGNENSVGDETFSGKTLGVRAEATGGERQPAVSVLYQLEAGGPTLLIRSRFTNETDRELSVPLTDSLRADGGKEQMGKAPNGVSDMYWFDDRYWQQAYGIVAQGRRIQTNNARESTLKFVDTDDQSSIKLAPGESFELTRRITAGQTMLHVHAAFDNDKTVPVALRLIDKAGNPLPHAFLDIRSVGGLLGTARTNADGRTLPLPLLPKPYSVRVLMNSHIVEDDASLLIEATGEPITADITVGEFVPGRVTANIVDEGGQGIPCKVEFQPTGVTPRPDFGPESAEFAVRNLRYAPHGAFTQTLHPGTYDVIISHGPEYDAIFTEITVDAGEETNLEGKLIRSVDTSGWVSSDFHSHSSPSGDNTSSQLGRVLNLVCENIEFAPCTEHNRIDTYVPHIEQLDVGNFIGTCTGMELTGSPLPLNHQNVFPLHHHPHHQDGGGPITDSSPETQIERIALWDDRSEKLIQQNHPDIGWLFFDKDGDKQLDEGYSRSFGLIDVMEIHPISSMIRRKPFTASGEKQRNNRTFNWLQLLNRGFRIPGVVNTDAHYNYHGSGWLRNWIESPTDEPAKIDTMDVVHAAEHGHLVMSNGPFLEVRATASNGEKSFTAGDDMTAAEGKVDLHIKVQCPNWHDINRVFVLVNGRLGPKLNFDRLTNANQFGEKPVKFDEHISLQLESDAHLIVVAAGEGLKLGPVQGPDWGDREPTAVANPIFVDVDGDGFKPNQDTLDHPLPVKAE